MFLLANSGTPLMFLGCGHLVFLNLLLGIVEARLICRFLKIERHRSLMIALVAANYASAVAGFFLLPVLWDAMAGSDLFDPPLRWLTPMLLISLAASFTGTLVIEAVFCLPALWRADRPIARKLRAFTLAQVITYAGLAVLYFLNSTFSVVSRVEYTDPSQLATRTEPGWVYYRDRSGELARTRLDGSETERLGVPVPTQEELRGRDRLLTIYPFSWEKHHLAIVRPNPEGRAHPAPGQGRVDYLPLPPGTPVVPFTREGQPGRYSFEIARIAPPSAGSISISWAMKPGDAVGFSTLTEEDGVDWQASFGLGTPLAMWARADHFSVLPNDIVVFAWGDEQIVIMDPDTGEAGVIARGSGPAVLLDDPTLAPRLRWPSHQMPTGDVIEEQPNDQQGQHDDSGTP